MLPCSPRAQEERAARVANPREESPPECTVESEATGWWLPRQPRRHQEGITCPSRIVYATIFGLLRRADTPSLAATSFSRRRPQGPQVSGQRQWRMDTRSTQLHQHPGEGQLPRLTHHTPRRRTELEAEEGGSTARSRIGPYGR